MVNSRKESWVISLLTVLIRRMKELKTIMAKSFNLIKGLEMLSKSVTTANLGRQSSAQQLRLKAFQKKSLLIPLRQSVYRSGYEMMMYLRDGVQDLVSTAPLAYHIDHKDQYLAFIDMNLYGLQETVQDDRLTVTQLKDIIHLYLLHQSEYLRRVTLGISTLQPKHLEDITEKISLLADSLGNILRYEEAMEVTTDKPDTKLVAPHNILNSTGLHLHACLLMVRNMQDISSYSGEEEPTGEQLPELLQGLEEVQTILKRCQDIIEDGISSISNITKNNQNANVAQYSDTGVPDPPPPINDRKLDKKICWEDETTDHLDEVFEAYTQNCRGNFNTCSERREEEVKNRFEKKQSKKVLRELKTALVSKQREWKVIEARAIARQNGEAFEETDNVLDISDEDNEDTPCDRLKIQTNASSDSSCSDSESSTELLGKKMMFRRPLRPAAIKLQTVKCELQSEEGTRLLNTQPIGFDNSLAEAAVARCIRMRTDFMPSGRGEEECFGESDNSCDDS